MTEKARQYNVINVAFELKYVITFEMLECEKENIYLLLTTALTGFLWILSEIIGSSKCSAGGVFEFVLYGYCVEISRDTRHEERHETRERTPSAAPSETTLLIDPEM